MTKVEQTQVENQAQEADENADLIAKLRGQKAESEQRDYKAGFEEGVWYAQRGATYDEFAHLEEIAERAERGCYLSPSDLIPGSEGLESVYECVTEYMTESGTINAEVFWEGWLAGVMSVWEAVKDKV